MTLQLLHSESPLSVFRIHPFQELSPLKTTERLPSFSCYFPLFLTQSHVIGKENTDKVPLKVHKIENFFGFDFEFCTISMLVIITTCRKVPLQVNFFTTFCSGVYIVNQSMVLLR
jgi:hypothetical protein